MSETPQATSATGVEGNGPTPADDGPVGTPPLPPESMPRVPSGDGTTNSSKSCEECEECERQKLILDAYKVLTEEIGRYNTTIWQYPISLVAANALLFSKTELLQTTPLVLIAFSMLDLAIVYSLFKHIFNQETLILRIRTLELGISTALKSVPEISDAFSATFDFVGKGKSSIMSYRAAILVATALWLGATALGFVGLRIAYTVHATGKLLWLGWACTALYGVASIHRLLLILRELPMKPRRNGLSPLALEDLADLPALTQMLQAQARPCDIWLKGQLSSKTQEALNCYPESGSNRETLKEALQQDLNQLIRGSSIYEEKRFEGVLLSSGAKSLLSQDPQGGDKLRRLNRLLIEDAYLPKLTKNRPKQV